MTEQDLTGTAHWKTNLATILAFVVGIVALDQVTKFWVTSSLSLGQSVPVVAGFFHLTLVRNTGMAFGLLSGSDIPFKAVLVTFLSTAAMVAVTYYALRSAQHERLTRYGLIFILGGAVGNIVDRVRLGYVVDFVDVFYGGTHWPAFNVADSCICIGVGLLLLDSFRKAPRPGLAPKAEAAAAASRGDN